MQTGELAYQYSQEGTKGIVQALLTAEPFDISLHRQTMKEAGKHHRAAREEQHCKVYKALQTTENLPELTCRQVEKAANEKINAWLSLLPTRYNHQDLSAKEFRDALACRYGCSVENAPQQCDGCGAGWDLHHALTCKTGGLITTRHNEVNHVWSSLVEVAFGKTRKEVVVREGEMVKGLQQPGLKVDFIARGVWEAQTTASFDTTVVYSDAMSYAGKSYEQTLQMAEARKKKKYGTECDKLRIHFTPLASTTDAVLGKEAQSLLRKVVDTLVDKWGKGKGVIMAWARVRLQLAHARALSLCIRGVRGKLRELGAEDGVGAAAALD
jgi:hypothetical protein